MDEELNKEIVRETLLQVNPDTDDELKRTNSGYAVLHPVN